MPGRISGSSAVVAPAPDTQSDDAPASPKDSADTPDKSRMRTWVTLTFPDAMDFRSSQRMSSCMDGDDFMDVPSDNLQAPDRRSAKAKLVKSMDDICVSRYCCCYTAYARHSDGSIHQGMEVKFAHEKYVHFRGAFIQVAFLMPLGALALAINAGLQEHWARLGLLLGGVAPLYLLYAVFGLRKEEKYLSMSGTGAEFGLIALFCIHTVLIVVAEWVRPDIDYGMLAMHIGFVHNFTPLSAGSMQAVTAIFGLLPYCVLRILRFTIDEHSTLATLSDGLACGEVNPDESAALGIITPLVVFIYQVFVTMRRDESLRIDALTGELLDRQQALLVEEEEKNQGMLMSMLPRQIIESLKAQEHIEPQFFADVTVIFVEICKFPRLCSYLPPGVVVQVLNIIYHEFDRLSDLLSVYKVETVGQVYMAVVGAPEPIANHADVAAHFGLAAQESMRHMRSHLDTIVQAGLQSKPLANGHPSMFANASMRALASTKDSAGKEAPVVVQNADGSLDSRGGDAGQLDAGVQATQTAVDLTVQVRVGLNSGQLRAGVVGMDSPRYKLFGDTVNTASRMESTCEPGKVQVSPSTLSRLTTSMFLLEDRGEIPVKGKGTMRTSFLVGYEGPEPADSRKILIERERTDRNSTQEFLVEKEPSVGGRLSLRRSLGSTRSKEVVSCNSNGADPRGGDRHGSSVPPVPHATSQHRKDLGEVVMAPLDFLLQTLGKEADGPRLPSSKSRWPLGSDHYSGSDSCSEHLWTCLDRLQTFFLLVPKEQKTPEWMAELRADRPTYQQQNLPRQLSFARTLTIILLLVLALLSTLDFFMENTFVDIDRYKTTILIRALGTNVVGLAYLLSLATPRLTRRMAQSLTMLMLIVQGASMLVSADFLYKSEPMMIGMVAMYGAYSLFYTVCTIAQRLALCALTVVGYVVIMLANCGTSGVMDAAQNIAFLIVFEICMASGVQLQEHLQHVSHYEQRVAQQRLHKTKQAKTAGAGLLNNLLPQHVIPLVREGVSPIAEYHSLVTVIFTDIKGFTAFSSKVSPHKLFTVLNSMYSAFDEVIANWALHRVEIIGDAYFIVAGCPARHTKGQKDRTDPSEWAMRAVEVGLALQRTLPSVCDDSSVQMRVGLHTGSVVAGVVGKKGPRYHLFGTTVGYAEVMESSGIPGRVQISDATHQILENGGHAYDFEERAIEVEGEDEVQRTWLVNKSNSKEAIAIQKRLMAQRRNWQQSDNASDEGT